MENPMSFSKSANEAARTAAAENELPVEAAHDSTNRFSKRARLEQSEQMESCDLLTMDSAKYLEFQTETQGLYRIYANPDHTEFFIVDMLINQDVADPKEFEGRNFNNVTAQHMSVRVGDKVDGGEFRTSPIVSMTLKNKR
jgi:hypothetical protein